MPAQLAMNYDLFKVPADLTYFEYDGRYLVVNPHVGARCVLDAAGFRVLRSLSRAYHSGTPPNFAHGSQTESTLAKLLLSWVVYYNGHEPKPQIKEPPLRQVYYAITDGCNLRCPYCYASSEKCLPGELTTDEAIDLVSQSADIGAETIIFTGGEPMLRKDLFTVVEHAKSLGLRANMVTNATLIRNQQIAERIAELFTTVTVSVDGATAETHDRTRGRGSFEKTRRALGFLNAAGVRPNINHVITSDNVENIEDFSEFLQGIEVKDVRLMNHNNLGRGVDDEYDFGWSDHVRVQEIVWTSPVAGALRPDGPKSTSPCSIKGNCGMGGNEIYVNSLGNVYPCKLVTENVHYAGNVRKKPLKEIFASKVLSRMRESTVYGGDIHTDCQKCYIRSSCGGGCRAYHMAESGDIARNSRHLCRILRHGMVTQLWREAGVSFAGLAEAHHDMTLPRMVLSGELHEVYEDWKTFTPLHPTAVKVGEQIPITPV